MRAHLPIGSGMKSNESTPRSPGYIKGLYRTQGDSLAGESTHRRNEGTGSRRAGLAMCVKLIEATEGRWRRVNAPELVALVRAGAKFANGRLIERTDKEDAA